MRGARPRAERLLGSAVVVVVLGFWGVLGLGCFLGGVGFFFFFPFLTYSPPGVFILAHRLHAMCVRARLRFLCRSVSGDDMKNKG